MVQLLSIGLCRFFYHVFCLKTDPWRPKPDLGILDQSKLPVGSLQIGKMLSEEEDMIGIMVNSFRTW